LTEETLETTEIKDTDIVFDCPHCSKSLAIDYRGAGLTIPCTDCGNYVEVPIPEGMDIADIDSTAEEQEVRILNLRRSLSSAESRIAQLEEELMAMMSRREQLEDARTNNLGSLKSIRENAQKIKDGLSQMTEAINAILISASEKRD
jgi:transcription elongation factor Elf1